MPRQVQPAPNILKTNNIVSKSVLGVSLHVCVRERLTDQSLAVNVQSALLCPRCSCKRLQCVNLVCNKLP